MKRILLIMIGFSLWLNAGFTRDANGIVSDSTTGLQWQDDYSDNKGSIKSATWSDALGYCEGLTLGGLDDWRLPNVNELYGIGDRSRYNPAIDSTFQNVIPNYYWSSTTTAYDADNAWVVHFNSGNDNWNNKSASFYVRCVRDGQ